MSFLYKNPEYQDFKKLTKARIKEASILLNKKQYSGAYYLAGYSIEFALKACYCKSVKKNSFPPKKDIYQKLYNHDLSGLLDVSGIKGDFNKQLDKNNDLKSNWGIVKDWNEESRYSIIDSKDAEAVVKAISEENGILKLIQKLW